jgi:ferritin-like metal-binding protein YciE
MLPRLQRDADSAFLTLPLSEHLAQTREHAERVENLFVAADAEPAAAASAPLEALRRRYDELRIAIVEPRLRDLFLIESARTTEALEIALYTSLIPLGRRLRIEIAPLKQNLEDEEHALEQLERLADTICSKLPV